MPVVQDHVHEDHEQGAVRPEPGQPISESIGNTSNHVTFTDRLTAHADKDKKPFEVCFPGWEPPK